MFWTPKHFSGKFVSRNFFPYFYDNGALHQINNGRCYDWAYLAHRLFGVKIWSTDFHAWIQYGNRFYDSEVGRNGVSNFMKLGCNMRNAFPLPWSNDPPRTMELENFKNFWNIHGGGRRHHWESFLEPQLRNVLGKKYSETTPIFPAKVPPPRIIL